MTHITVPVKGGLVLLDAADEPYINARKVRSVGRGNRLYAEVSVGRRSTLLHRLLLNAPRGLMVDHINGDGLDNRRANLRLATARQNSTNRRAHGAVQFVGVRRAGAAYFAAICPAGRQIHLGQFATSEEAAAAYDAAARVLYGEFTRLNNVGVFDLAPVIARKRLEAQRLLDDAAMLEGSLK